ncbi:MAG: SRPBCC domain-containing protein [Polyangiaceae bacterium]
MSFVETTARGQTHTIAFEWELPHPPAKVWRALTDPALLAKWLLPVFDLALEAGATFTFKTDPVGGWDGVVNCRMLDVREHESLRYAWTVGNMDTIVTFTLAPSGTGTKLTMTQAGFTPEQKQNFGGARYGWKKMGTALVDVVASLA